MPRSGNVAFTLYVLLAATRWVLDTAYPSTLPSRCVATLAASLLCLCVLLFPSGRTSRIRTTSARGRYALIPGAFACALVAAGTVGAGLPALTRTALFSLVPAATVLAAAAWESASADFDFMRGLGAALAGVAGVMLLVPTDLGALARHPVAALALLVVVGVLGVGGVGVYPALRAVTGRVAAWMVLGPMLAAQVGLLLWERQVFPRPHLGDAPAILWESAELGCLLYGLRSVSPVPLAARYLLVPLVGAAEGLLVVRPALTLRMVLGLVLLACGAAGLLRPAGEPDSAPLLR